MAKFSTKAFWEMYVSLAPHIPPSHESGFGAKIPQLVQGLGKNVVDDCPVGMLVKVRPSCFSLPAPAFRLHAQKGILKYLR